MIQLQGKYNRRSRYYTVRMQRAALRTLLRPLVSWRPMAAPLEGYSVVLGCTKPLAEMLSANLLMLSRQDLSHLGEVIVVIDCLRDALPEGFERKLRERYPDLPLRVMCYSPRQVKVAGMIGWAWVYSWMSWCIGIAAAQTRYVVLHDFDAMLIRPDVLRERYEQLRHQPIDYLGVRYYSGNGVMDSDGLVTTFEMMFDCSFVRHHFRPIDLFNQVCRWRGRTVDFDTFLYAQSRLGRTEVMPLEEGDMVHPSQMICQFTELMNGRELNPTRSSLLLIPYFLSVGGSNVLMQSITRQLSRNGNGGVVDFYGAHLHLGRLSLTHAQWLAMQAQRLEEALHGSVRSGVRAYFNAVLEHAHQDDHVLATAR